MFAKFLPNLLFLLLMQCALLAQDMPLSQVLIDGENWELVAEGFQFTEGPAVDAEGNIYFTDIPASKIFHVNLEGKLTTFVENSNKTNGLMFGPDGLLYGCQNGSKKIVAYDSAGKANTIAEGINSNDLTITPTGDLYITDPSNKRVWHIAPNGNKKVVAEGFRPNGIISWAQGGTLVVTDSDEPHLWTFRIQEDGSLTDKERYYQPLQIPSGKDRPGSDGMTVDVAGRLYVATYAGLQMFDPTGRISGTILKPQPAFLSNVVFGGPDLSYLYVTCQDKVYRRKTKTKGIRLTSPKN